MGWVAKLGDGTGGGLGASTFDSSVCLRTGVFLVVGLVASSEEGFRASAPLLVDDSSSWAVVECFLAGVRIGSEYTSEKGEGDKRVSRTSSEVAICSMLLTVCDRERVV